MATGAQKGNSYLHHIISIANKSYTTDSNLYTAYATDDIKRAHSDDHDLITATIPDELTLLIFPVPSVRSLHFDLTVHNAYVQRITFDMSSQKQSFPNTYTDLCISRQKELCCGL